MCPMRSMGCVCCVCRVVCVFHACRVCHVWCVGVVCGVYGVCGVCYVLGVVYIVQCCALCVVCVLFCEYLCSVCVVCQSVCSAGVIITCLRKFTPLKLRLAHSRWRHEPWFRHRFMERLAWLAGELWQRCVEWQLVGRLWSVEDGGMGQSSSMGGCISCLCQWPVGSPELLRRGQHAGHESGGAFGGGDGDWISCPVTPR